MPDERRVKNHKLFEGVSPSFCDLVTRFRHPQHAHGESKIDFLRIHQFSIFNFQYQPTPSGIGRKWSCEARQLQQMVRVSNTVRIFRQAQNRLE